jgi:hypothetical protein
MEKGFQFMLHEPGQCLFEHVNLSQLNLFRPVTVPGSLLSLVILYLPNTEEICVSTK